MYNLGCVVIAMGVFLVFANPVLASRGDRAAVHEECMIHCLQGNCSSLSAQQNFLNKQSFHLKLFLWNCESECKYACMWKTVDWFIKQYNEVPQFYGKWPFIRIFGIQEPASTVFSIFNGLTHYVSLIRFQKEVPPDAPFYSFHKAYAFICINSWIWSTIFHARDFQFTEMMDYFCALMPVMYSFFFLIIRALSITKGWKLFTISSIFLFVYIRHITFLAFVKFDYAYNMAVAVTVGLTTTFGWLVWCAMRWVLQPYVWRCAATVVTVALLVLLEVKDFPPLWYTFDAHSLWHMCTIPMPFLWCQFVIDDCLYLLQNKKGQEKIS